MSISIDAISGQGLLDHVAHPTGDMRSLSEQFDRLMAHDPNAVQHNVPHTTHHESVGTDILGKSDVMMRQTFQNMQRFVEDAPNLNFHELAARQMEMTMQISVTNFQFTACTHVAQSGKNGMQTLMKNQ